jgi:AAA15 family ATPase/GTPase
MSKIQHIKISNFKSIDQFEADFKGCTAILTGGNNTGKSSFLRGIPDRIRFTRPDVMVRKGEREGKGEMVLTTGEKFIWEFDTDGKDKLVYINNEGLKKSVTVEFGRQFFPNTFDIDKFLQSPPRKQAEQLQAIVGLDFTEIDKRYEHAYNIRTERNREAEIYHVKLEKMLRVDPIQPVDLTELQAKKQFERNRLNNLYIANKTQNDASREQWNKEKEGINQDVSQHNEAQQAKQTKYEKCLCAFYVLVDNGYKGDANAFIDSLKEQIQPLKIAAELYPTEPEYIQEMPDSTELDKIDADILAASEINAKAAKYKEYVDHKKATEAAKSIAKEADELVISIEEERKRMIESANFPQGVSITPNGITVDGFPLDKNQISTSKLYCAALRIASMNLGEIKTLYFDASYLDRKSLEEIQLWANENDLQLLIERPDFEAGEMKYEIVETVAI